MLFRSKKIGILYTISSFVFLAVGGLLALGVRAELAQPGLQFLDESAYNQLFTMHASVMIFWVIIPFLAGFGNYIVPLQIGAPDMAYPRINALSFWMIPFAGLIAVSGFFLGGQDWRDGISWIFANGGDIAQKKDGKWVGTLESADSLKGLQQLQDTYADQGLVVLGFPCDQFGNQEPGSEAEISEFCERNFGVTFPLFSKVDVNGDGAHPLFQWLKDSKGGLLGSKIKWNFTKFLVGRDGRVLRRYAPNDAPESLRADIEAALGS